MIRLLLFLSFFFAVVRCGTGLCPYRSCESTTEARTPFSVVTVFNTTVEDISFAADGSGDIYVVGDFTSVNDQNFNRIVRLNSDGSIDSAFDPGTGFGAAVRTVWAATDGTNTVYVGHGSGTFNGSSTSRIIRLFSDGSRDTNFSASISDSVRGIEPVPDGSGDIYIAGHFGAINSAGPGRIVRVNSDGSIDSAYDRVGSGPNSHVRRIVLAPDGKIYATGFFTNFSGVASQYWVRINTDGTRDTSFSVGTGANSVSWSTYLASDGSNKAYLAGSHGQYNGVSSDNLTRTNSDGSLDTSWSTSFDDNVRDVVGVVDASNDILVVGRFLSMNGQSAPRMLRLRSDGSINTLFVNPGLDGTVHRIYQAPDGSDSYYLMGTFMAYGTNTVGSLMRIKGDGTID